MTGHVFGSSESLKSTCSGVGATTSPAHACMAPCENACGPRKGVEVPLALAKPSFASSSGGCVAAGGDEAPSKDLTNGNQNSVCVPVSAMSLACQTRSLASTTSTEPPCGEKMGLDAAVAVAATALVLGLPGAPEIEPRPLCRGAGDVAGALAFAGSCWVGETARPCTGEAARPGAGDVAGRARAPSERTPIASAAAAAAVRSPLCSKRLAA